ncbi:MAG: hypothetical protein JSR15_08150 [Proteobacteria bacterium]|nr:hypothetical protein [Pseudomonadota bacterium]
MQEAELYFVVGALLLYLLDSGLLLYGDELLFATGLSGWHNVAGGGQLLLGRRLLWPNPLLPAARLLRVCWSRASTDNVGGAPPAPATSERVEAVAFRRALQPLQFGVVVLLLLVAVALPALLYAYGPGLEVLLLLAAIYVLNLSMAAWLWHARSRLELGARACAMLTVDLLLCPPFAINLVRKISLQQQAAGDPLSFAQSRFGAARRRALAAVLRRRVHAELAADEPGGAQWRKLQALMHRVESLAA